ncbi:MAG: hypothetical protein EZS28_006057, partial [Streblomastix strix]
LAVVVIGVANPGTKLSYNANLSPGIVICQLTQHDYTIEHVALPLAPSGARNFGSKLLGGIKKVVDWVAPTLHKVIDTLSGPVSMLHPGAGQIMGTIDNIAGGFERHLNKH